MARKGLNIQTIITLRSSYDFNVMGIKISFLLRGKLSNVRTSLMINLS
ncbi:MULTISPECIES: hypothetical protein [unclassified Bartonella]